MASLAPPSAVTVPSSGRANSRAYLPRSRFRAPVAVFATGVLVLKMRKKVWGGYPRGVRKAQRARIEIESKESP